MSFLLIVTPWLIVAAGCWIGYQLIRQYGRLLIRLESLEQRLGSFEQQLTPLVTLAARAAQAGTPAAPAAPQGLPVGSQAPDFELSSLSGKRVSLTQYRGKKTLLVFFNPSCGYCAQMAPDLAKLHVDGRDDSPIPLVITAGDREANRQLVKAHKIRAPMLLQKVNEVAERYKAAGTPTGYLIDAEGRIASGVAVGAQALLALARSRSGKPETTSADEMPALGEGDGAVSGNGTGPKRHQGNLPLTASKIKRDGLAAGTAAPEFRLKRVDGGELSLADYHGRKVLLVFSDPHCGPCDALTPKLEELHRQRDDLEVILVSRGDVEENRKKVAQYGLSFPVVLQKHWEVSRSYAMFATPVGYIVDETGVLASDVAVGGEAILAAASRASSSPSTVNRGGVHME
jgi:peroxiredoxin